MNNMFEFATANRIIFGRGTIKRLPEIVSGMGSRALLLTTKSHMWANEVIALLNEKSIDVVSYSVDKEPSIELINQLVAYYRQNRCELIIAIGGGSVIDAGKAVAVMVTNEGSPLDYLEVIGKGKQLTKPPVPFIALPTTAGTGAEVTRNAVLYSKEHAIKISLRSPMMLPMVALVDSDLTCSVPPQVTAATGMDALTQVIEPFISSKATIFTDLFCREGIRRAGRSLERAYLNGDDAEAREDMSMVSLLGGLALANAKLGAVHGFAGVLGGTYGAPHGVVCARLLAPVLKTNFNALIQRKPNHPAIKRFEEFARLLVGKVDAMPADGIHWVADISDKLGLDALGKYGLVESDFPTIIEKSKQSSSMRGNPIMLTDGELSQILTSAL